MKKVAVFLESGKKKVFAGAVEWPGWSRSGRDEDAALQALVDYGGRYSRVLEAQEFDFRPPGDIMELVVVERHAGNASTDFGAPAALLVADRVPAGEAEFAEFNKVLAACWQAFDKAVQGARGKELRKGPRGGGRDLEQIVDHVLEADRAYLRRLAWTYKKDNEESQAETLVRTRQAILDALEAASRGELPERGPRGGTIWPPRYFVRRVAWHVLDHAWEIEDRIE